MTKKKYCKRTKRTTCLRAGKTWVKGANGRKGYCRKKSRCKSGKKRRTRRKPSCKC